MAPTEQSLEMVEGIIKRLFQRHDRSLWPYFVESLGTGAGDEKRFIDVELVGIAKCLSVEKAPGLGVVPNLDLKVIIAEAPEVSDVLCINDWMNESSQGFRSGRSWYFAEGGEIPGDLSAYLPIYLIDTAGKVIEKIILY